MTMPAVTAAVAGTIPVIVTAGVTKRISQSLGPGSSRSRRRVVRRKPVARKRVVRKKVRKIKRVRTTAKRRVTRRRR